MLLAVDVGNSHTTIGVFAGSAPAAAGAPGPTSRASGPESSASTSRPSGPDLRCELRVSTRHAWTRDEVAIGLRQALELADIRFADLDDAVIACVVPPALPALREALQRYGGFDPLVVGPGVRTGMPIRYDPPQDVGADRIVTAVAAHERHAVPAGAGLGVIVVDFGTATTFDVVSPQPEYLGGAIAPGIGISADALFARAAKLPRVDASKPDRVVGRNTVAAIQSGLMNGYLGLVEGLIARIRAEVDFPTRVVATGGFAGSLAPHTPVIDVVDDALVLEGLRIIHARNRSHAAAPRERGPGGR
jgi:type III pantothenate kinase